MILKIPGGAEMLESVHGNDDVGKFLLVEHAFAGYLYSPELCH